MIKHLLGKTEEIKVGFSRTYRAHGNNIFVINLDGQFLGYINYCPHMGGSLRFTGSKIQCNWHGATFNPVTGVALTMPALDTTGLEKVELMVEGDDLFYLSSDQPTKSAWADDF